MPSIQTKYTYDSLLPGGERVSEEQLLVDAKLLAAERAATRLSRRTVLASLAAGVAGAGLAGCSSSGNIVTTPIGTATPSVADVLNFALNLEYLEANFYLYLTTGSGLASANMGSNPGAITGGAKFNFTNTTIANVANQLANDENLHVQFLRSTIQTALNVAPVAQPALNLAALGTITTDAQFVGMARMLETVGISAYAGGAQYLVSSPAALTYAAQILDVEAQHEGLLRQICITLPATSAAVDAQDNPPPTAINANGTGIFNTNGYMANSTTVVAGLNPVRTTSQVLQIVYNAAGKTGVTAGGFFPNGLNGNIKST